VPFHITEPAFTNPVENPVLFPVAFPSTGTGGPETVGLPNAIRPVLRVPLSSQYSLTLERQQWNTGFRVTYTGTNTGYGVYRWDINQPVADAQLYVDKLGCFPDIRQFIIRIMGRGISITGVSMEIERRNYKGLHYQLYYTLAKDVQDLENNEIGEDAYNRLRERSTWGALPRHRWMGNANYDLPVGRLRHCGRGRIRRGRRFTNTQTRPTASRWFDVDAFAAPELGRFGTPGKGVIDGTPIHMPHGTVAKIFDVKERVKIRLEFLGNNALNHPN